VPLRPRQSVTQDDNSCGRSCDELACVCLAHIRAQEHWFRVTNAPAEMNEVIQTDASFVVFFLQADASAACSSRFSLGAAVFHPERHLRDLASAETRGRLSTRCQLEILGLGFWNGSLGLWPLRYDELTCRRGSVAPIERISGSA
jgi:hypothetical protein